MDASEDSKKNNCNETVLEQEYRIYGAIVDCWRSVNEFAKSFTKTQSIFAWDEKADVHDITWSETMTLLDWENETFNIHTITLPILVENFKKFSQNELHSSI